MLTPRQSIESVDDADRHARLLAHWSGADPVHPTDAEHFHIKRSNEHFGGRQFPALVKRHTGFEVDPHSGRTHEGTGDIRYSVNLRAPSTAEWRNESKTMLPSSHGNTEPTGRLPKPSCARCGSNEWAPYGSKTGPRTLVHLRGGRPVHVGCVRRPAQVAEALNLAHRQEMAKSVWDFASGKGKGVVRSGVLAAKEFIGGRRAAAGNRYHARALKQRHTEPSYAQLTRSTPPSVAEAVGAYLTAKRRLYVVECHLNGIPMLEADDPMNPTIKNFGDIVQHYGHKSLGPRQMGSTTDAALHDLIPHSTPVEEFRPHKDADVPIAKYYRLSKKDVQPEVWEKVNPKLGAVAYSSLSRAERANVKVRPGHAYGSAGFGDGRELYVDREPNQQHARGADHLTFIMGPIGDKLGAWTWHPGEALPVHDSHFTHGKASAHPEEIAKNPRYSAAPIADSFKSPNPKPMTAVKLHNG